MGEGGHLDQYATPSEVLGSPATAFVADFVGADRSLSRLAVVALKASDAEAAGPGEDPGPRVPRVKVGASLRDALVAVLDAPGAVVGVENDGGFLAGVLRPSSLHAAASRSLDDAASSDVA